MADPRLAFAKASRKRSVGAERVQQVLAGEESLASFLDLDGEARRQLIGRALAYVEAGHFGPAEEILQLLLAVGETHPVVQFLVARCLLAHGKLPEAREAATRAIEAARVAGLSEVVEGGARWLSKISAEPASELTGERSV